MARTHRREFLKRAAATAGAAAVASWPAPRSRAAGANSRVRVALLGVRQPGLAAPPVAVIAGRRRDCVRVRRRRSAARRARQGSARRRGGRRSAPRARRPVRRRCVDRLARPLACARGAVGSRRRQARVRREAVLAQLPRGATAGRRGEAVGAGRRPRHAVALIGRRFARRWRCFARASSATC